VVSHGFALSITSKTAKIILLVEVLLIKRIDCAYKSTSRDSNLCTRSSLLYKSRAIAGRTARCRCKFRHVLNCTALRGSACDSMAFLWVFIWRLQWLDLSKSDKY